MSRTFLLDHGTKLMVLKPQTLIQAAEADMARRRRNESTQSGTYEQYAFHRTHVKKAETAAELIALAASEPDIAATSAKYNTRLIYSDPDLLVMAKEMATA